MRWYPTMGERESLQEVNKTLGEFRAGTDLASRGQNVRGGGEERLLLTYDGTWQDVWGRTEQARHSGQQDIVY
jgi:hypothetical protein